MADGKTKAIERIQARDIVLAFDGARGALATAAVAAVHPPKVVDSYFVVNGSLRVSATQPVLSDGSWVRIEELKIGDSLTSANGTTVPIRTMELVEEPILVFNLQVDSHGVYVAGGILVHNKDLPMTLYLPDE